MKCQHIFVKTFLFFVLLEYKVFEYSKNMNCIYRKLLRNLNIVLGFDKYPLTYYIRNKRDDT